LDNCVIDIPSLAQDEILALKRRVDAAAAVVVAVSKN
jgi:hypothetical protein